MRNYCTMFNSTYLTRGIALYESLERYGKDFHLYVIAFDVHTYEILSTLNYKNMTLIKRTDFECARLLQVKSERSVAEYFWTSTPFSIEYCIKKYDLDSCTYLDADIYFFSDPEVLFQELKENDSVIITDHRYSPQYDQTEISGRYCVQFMFFKKDKRGQTVLNWWMDRCFEWCYARSENGKFGDQKYLDVWPEIFEGICDLSHQGGGAAPWNIQQYSLRQKSGRLEIKNICSDKSYDLVFYHFHGFRYLTRTIMDLGFYELTPEVKEWIYKPYIEHLDMINTELDDRKLSRLMGKASKPMSLWSEIKKLYRHRKNILTIQGL